MPADSDSTYLSHTWNDAYCQVGQLTQVSDGSPQTEAYQHDPQGNLISETTGTAQTSYVYSRGLLQSSTTSGLTSTYNYDPLGRLDTVTGPGGIQESSTYDGFDNVISRTQGSGSSAVVTTYNYDPLNRVTSGTTGSNTTSYIYLGLTSQVSSQTDPGGITKTYGYTPGGLRLFQATGGDPTASLNGTAYYTYNNHSDVQALTGPAGPPTATYGYTAYGSPVASMFTGADASNANPGPNVVPYNSYRFNAMQWDPSSGQYNMGFRNYAPGVGSFTTRDMYNDPGSDMSLSDGSLYGYGDADPIGNIELDGHSWCSFLPAGCGTLNNVTAGAANGISDVVLVPLHNFVGSILGAAPGIAAGQGNCLGCTAGAAPPANPIPVSPAHWGNNRSWEYKIAYYAAPFLLPGGVEAGIERDAAAAAARNAAASAARDTAAAAARDDAAAAASGAAEDAGSGAADTVFRADARGPEEIFPKGFVPKGNNMDLLKHASSNPSDSGYVSTSSRLGFAQDWAAENGYDYIYKLRATGRDVNAELGADSPFPWENEIAVPRPIPGSDIQGVWGPEGWMDNPGFAP